MTTLKEALDQLAKGHELDNEQKKLIIDKWQKELGIQPCKDCISRQAVLAINENHHGQMPNEVNYQIWEEIKALPPVTPQPKMGHWVFDEILDKNYYCSECKSMGVDYCD